MLNKKSKTTILSEYWPHYLFVPSSVSNLPALLTSFGWSQTEIDNHQDKVAYVLNLIITAQVFNKAINDSNFVNISQRILGDIIGPRYVPYVLNLLLESGVIESDGKYYNWSGDNAKALGYRITAKAQSKAVGLLVFKQETFGKKLAKLHEQEEVELRKDRFLNRIYRDIKSLRIRYAAAVEHNDKIHSKTSVFLAQHYQHIQATSLNKKAYTSLLNEAFQQDSTYIQLPDLKAVRSSLDSKMDTSLFEVITNLILCARNSNHAAITKIHTQDFKIPVRDKQDSGHFARVYTNLTNLSSSFRQFLYCGKSDSERLINLDIKNSQPFLLCLLLNKIFGLENQPADVKRYIQLTSTGEFYTTVAKVLGLEFRNDREKRQFKSWFFGSVFFCKNLHAANSKAGKYFQQAFPNVYQVISEYKQENYNHLALVMQKEEAAIMLDEVVKTLHEKKIWNCSIHDSIVCLESKADEVKDIILDAFKTKYNLVPSVDSKPFEIEDEYQEIDFDDNDFPYFRRIAC